jgi:hypothetical protein
VCLQISRRMRLLGTLRGRRGGLWEEQREFDREAVAGLVPQLEDFSQRMGMGGHTRGGSTGWIGAMTNAATCA